MIFLAGVDQNEKSLMRRFLVPGLFVLALFVTLYMRRPDPETTVQTVSLSGPTMGTSWKVSIVVPLAEETVRERAVPAIQGALERVNASMSTYIPDSELSKFNARASMIAVPVSDELSFVLRSAARISVRSGGAFDVTVGPLVNAWGFGPTKVDVLPTEETLKTLRGRVGFQKVELNAAEKTVRKTTPEVYVDLSAIAKGYGVDQVSEALTEAGFTRYMVEIGGEVKTRGQNSRGGPWRLGIEKPSATERAVLEVVALENKAMATSGDYRNFYEKDGVRVSHTVDPRTGRPITHRLASVTVVSDDCISADGWATALNVLGPEEGLTIAKREGLAALFLTKTDDGAFKESVTPAFESIRSASLSKAASK